MFLVPLYLVDVHGTGLGQLGGLLMINPGMMAIMVRIGGWMTTRFSDRMLAIIGLLVQGSVMFIFSQLPAGAPVWAVALNLGYYGFGAGLMLVALHHASMQSISQDQMGMAAGLYSMLRFMGMAIGTALAGVILQRFLDLSLPVIKAYQMVFLFYCAFPVLGVIAATGLVEGKKKGVQ